MGSKRNGLSMVELLTAVVLMGIIAGVSSISIKTSRQLPKREAEKIATYFAKLTQKADCIKMNFTASIDDNDNKNKISVTWTNSADESLTLDTDLVYTAHFNSTDITNTDITEWTYTCGGGVNVYSVGEDPNGGRYIAITYNDETPPHYVVITSED